MVSVVGEQASTDGEMKGSGVAIWAQIIKLQREDTE